MSDNNKKDNMFDTTELDALDKQISQRLGRGSLVGKMKTESKKVKAAKSAKLLSWENEWKQYWYVYIFLAVSSVFTMTLGVYMGISPKISGNLITYQTDAFHIFLALVYAVSFITVTEAAFVIGKWLFFTREEDNDTQKFTMIAMMILAGASVLFTGIAGGMVIASNIAFLSEFVEIPANAQKWVVVAIPTLITIYTFLVTAYGLSSDSAASERMIREQKRASDLDNQTRQHSIEQIAGEQLQIAELKRYMELVADGKISAADAKAAIRAGRTLGQEEKRQGRDIDGRDGIGNLRPAGAYQSTVELADNKNGNHPNSAGG